MVAGPPRERAKHVCIKVPKPAGSCRERYQRCESREAWVKCVLGPEGVYVGRPKNDGGWYMSPTVKAGSLFANPFPIKEYPLEESLQRYRDYLVTRSDSKASTDSVVEQLPPKLAVLARRRFAKGAEAASVGKSVAHLELSVVGAPFRAKLRLLAGRSLGCFCEESEPCHAKVLADAAEQELAAAAVTEGEASSSGAAAAALPPLPVAAAPTGSSRLPGSPPL